MLVVQTRIQPFPRAFSMVRISGDSMMPIPSVASPSGNSGHILLEPIRDSCTRAFSLTSWYPLVNEHNYGKSTFLMGKLTISMAMFNSFLYVYQLIEAQFCTKNIPKHPKRRPHDPTKKLIPEKCEKAWLRNSIVVTLMCFNQCLNNEWL